MKAHFRTNVICFLLGSFFLISSNVNGQFSREDIWLEMDDGVKLDVSRFTPLSEKPAPGYPAIVFVHGLGGSKLQPINSAREYAKNGFVTVTYSVRGQGDSEGLSTVFCYREQQDLENIVNSLVEDPMVNAEKIGVNGGSQGGFHAWFAGVNGMKVKAVAPENSVPVRVDAMARNDCYSFAISAELEYNEKVRIDTSAFPLKRWLLADNYDSVRAVVNRGRYFDADDVAASSAHYLMMGAWHDHAFPHNRMVGAYAASPLPSYIYIGTGGHGSEDSRDENDFRRDLKQKFFHEILKEEYCGLDTLKPVIMSLGPDWKHFSFDSWPPEEQEFQTYYLHSDNTLSLAPPSDSDGSMLIQHKLLESSYSWTDAVNEHFRSTISKFNMDRKTWRSDPLPDTLRILGIPTAEVYAKSTASKFQINLQLYAESPTGELTYLSQTSLGERENSNTTSWHQKTGEFIIIGWEIPAGYRLRLDWASINQTLDDTSLWTVPYWIADGDIELAFNANNPSSISIPVLNYTSTNISDQRFNNSKISKYKLFQNYPNPFNSSTKISYQPTKQTVDLRLSAVRQVELKIYNINGKRVRTLINENKSSGNHSFVWKGEDDFGNSVSSGMYFYQLRANNNILGMNKMLLIY